MSKIVDRTLDFLELFASEKRPLSLTDLSRLLGIPASSCHDVIRALEARGYVYETAPRAGFYPTRRWFDLARVIVANDSVTERAKPLLEKISADLGETVTLSKATGLRAIYLLVIEPADPVRYSVSAGSEVASLHATSVGKALLATLDAKTLAATLKERTLTRFTPRTIVSRSKLVAELDASRARDWFINDEESRPGVVTVSCAFVWSNAIHMLTIAGPASRMRGKLKKAAERVTAGCRELDQRQR
jgi:DNA-binding IclR family transcriptional regulator